MGQIGDLLPAIVAVLGDESLTYRQIAKTLNEDRKYIPSDGLWLAVQQVRDCVRRHGSAFTVNRTPVPHLVSRSKSVSTDSLREAG